ncbi:MAG: ABC transporter permease [Chitinophagaceae bacterium]
MFKNYFKTAWRNLVNNKVYSALNIMGLAIGMAIALVIALWVYHENSYDHFLPGYQQLYQVKLNHTTEGHVMTNNAVNLPLAGVLRKEIPEIKNVAETDWNDNHSLMVNDKKLYLRGLRVNNNFLNMFQYPLLKGSAGSVLNDAYSIVLTESTARALFGNEDPINKIVRYDNENNLKVTGVLKDLPGNTSLWFSYLMPFSYREQTTDWIKEARTQWGNNSFQVFVQLQPNVTYAQIEPKIRDIVKKNSDMKHTEVMLHAMSDWKLRGSFENGKIKGGYIEYIRLFSIIGILVLLIACINFMNLSTARSEKRAREVGVRKAVGSQRRHLIAQFLVESLLITTLAFVVALLLAQLSLPFFNSLAETYLEIPYNNAWFWIAMIGLILITGLIAGSRPAFYLSSFRPVKVLKGTLQIGRAASLPRKILVVLQFSCSVALIISTVIVYQQIRYIKNRPVGYDSNRLLMTDMSSDLNKNYTALKNDLMQSGYVENVTRASSPITNIYFHTIIEKWPGKTDDKENINIGALGVSDNYFKTLGMQLIAGRDFNDNWAADTTSVIINEAAAKKMNLSQSIGQPIEWNGDQKVTIIGVVKNSLMESPFSSVAPALFYHGRSGSSLMYRLKPDVSTQDALAKFGPLFDKYNPAYPYSYKFVDQDYASKFNLELLIGKLAGLFAALAIFISCLGLFGLAAYVAEQRTKEIGIRKVLGASVSQLWMLVSKDFLLLVAISCVIASPVALYFLKNWLQQYEYRISIGPLIFIGAAASAIVITLLTISFQALKAATANPVKAIKSE